MKRGIDIFVSIVMLLLTSPFICLFVVVIRLGSTGPALFAQMRVGKDGRPFSIFKLRTMFIDAVDIRNADSTTFNSRNDPRVTWIGHFLRRTSCDEIPQFLNVLLGDMSLVGPRPELCSDRHWQSRSETIRLRVRPGLTGLAVIHGRNDVPIQIRRELDAQYAEHLTLFLDLRILMKTVLMILRATGVNHPDDSGIPRLGDTYSMRS